MVDGASSARDLATHHGAFDSIAIFEVAIDHNYATWDRADNSAFGSSVKLTGSRTGRHVLLGVL